MIQQLIQQLRNDALQYLHNTGQSPTKITEGLLDDLGEQLQRCQTTHELATILLLLPVVEMHFYNGDRWSDELADLAIQVGIHTW